MRYWLCKSEPKEYSISDLAHDRVGCWDGIRNYQVRNMIRDDMQVGDRALFYHSNAGKQTGIVGEMEIVAGPSPDPAQFDPQNEYFDASVKADAPRWWCFTVSHKKTFSSVLSLIQLRQDPVCADLSILRRGNRLSIIPLSATQFKYLVRLASK